MSDPHRQLREAFERSLLDAPGETTPELRAAVAAGPGQDPAPLASYLAKVRANAWRITDDEVAALTSGGWSDDALFELTLAATMGEAQRQLEAAFGALDAFESDGEGGGRETA